MVKANELQPGDMIRTEIYSFLWKRKVPATALVISIREFSGSYSIMAKAFDGIRERIVDVFVRNGELIERSITQ